MEYYAAVPRHTQGPSTTHFKIEAYIKRREHFFASTAVFADRRDLHSNCH